MKIYARVDAEDRVAVASGELDDEHVRLLRPDRFERPVRGRVLREGADIDAVEHPFDDLEHQRLRIEQNCRAAHLVRARRGVGNDTVLVEHDGHVRTRLLRVDQLRRAVRAAFEQGRVRRCRSDTRRPASGGWPVRSAGERRPRRSDVEDDPQLGIDRTA